MGYTIIRFDDDGTTPAPPAGKTNVKFQGVQSNNNQAQINVSAYVDSIVEGQLSLSDVTTGNVSTTKHGFAPKAPNDATKYLDGTGAYSVPSTGSGSGNGLTGRLHAIWFNDETTLSYANTRPALTTSSFWSKVGGTFTVFASSSSGGKPACWELAVSSGNGSIAEDAVAAQGCMALFKGFSALVGLNDLNTGQVFWLGMSSVLYSSLGSNASPAGTVVGFRYKQGTDTHWQAYVGTATGTDTVVDTGVTPDTNFHSFEFFKNASGGIDFYIDDSKVATIASGATGFPAANTPLYCVLNANSASSTTGIDFAGLQWWSK